jgi:endonuclease/exonuclease/phosphatase family metal-dependent hydrolase
MPIDRLLAVGLVAALIACSSPYPPEPEADAGSGAFRVGTWNLEYLHDSHARGFPEYFFGGPLYDPRTENDYAAIADVIARQLDFAILALQEVDAEAGSSSAWGGPKSAELERLVGYLGGEFDYVVTQSGHPQHVAILWNQARARADTVFEIRYPEIQVDGQDLFDRDPLVAKFTLLTEGGPQNDLVIVALHLASGRANVHNHDSAFALLVDTLTALASASTGPLAGERDILIAGDLNFDLFDADRETYVEAMELGPWDVLADWQYPRTRLGGVPLVPEARLDYLICTEAMRGSPGLIEQFAADVHGDLAAGDNDRFRAVYSDHFPVSVFVRLRTDGD